MAMARNSVGAGGWQDTKQVVQDVMDAPSEPLRGMTGKGCGASRRELLWVAGLLLLALFLREYPFVGSGWVAGACGEPFLQEIVPILRSGNPLHFETFFYPPVPAIIAAGFIGAWRMLGGGGPVAIQCGALGGMFSLATVGIVYLLGRLWGRPHGVIAAAFYAATMIAVMVQGNVQVYSAFFLVLAIYTALRATTHGKTRTVALAGIWLGLGVASKYTPLFFAGILLAPYLLRRQSSESAAEVGDAGRASAEHGRLFPLLWAGGAWVLLGLTLGLLWVGLVERDLVYQYLRGIYERYSHENPFEYHLLWIDRLYVAILLGMALVGLVVGLALLIPWVRNKSPWTWARSFGARNRLWLVPCLLLILTVTVTIGLPAAFNLNDFARHFVHIAEGRMSGDNGFFPGHRPAPSYVGAYIPESTGLPLYLAGLVGILYVVWRRDRRALLLLASALPAYLMLELNRVKANWYAMELLLLWALLAGIWLGDLCRVQRKAWRMAGLGMALVIAGYSAVYSLAWAEFFGVRRDAQREAGEWLTATVPPGTSLGAKSALLVNGSPELLPDPIFLAPFRLVDYSEDPEYVILPNAVHAVVVQYLEGVQKGYVYKASDWFVSAPSATDLAMLSRIVREEGYILLEEFRKRPELFGIAVGSDSLTGRTWLAEHHRGIGIRIYRRTPTRR